MTCSRGSTTSIFATVGISGAISGLTAYFATKANEIIQTSLTNASEQYIQYTTVMLTQLLTHNITLPLLPITINGFTVSVQLPTMQLQEFISSNVTASIGSVMTQGFEQIKDVSTLAATTEISLHGGTLALLAVGIGSLLTTLIMKNNEMKTEINKLKHRVEEVYDEGNLIVRVNN